MKRLFAVVIALSPAVAVADDTASLAYQQAVDLSNQGKWEQACPFYEASYKADPQIGVLLHLADCHEHVGKLASAWAEYNDAVELAHRKGDNREKLAQQRADALKPKLARLHINVPAPVPGLSVRRDGVDITVLVGTDLPIDPGEHEIVAAAPGFNEWKKKITIGTLPTTVPLDVPALEKAAEKPVETPVVVTPPASHPTTLSIFAQPGAQISIDDKPVGAGHFEGEVTVGKHTVHVTAPGAKPYTNDVYVKEGENHAVEVSLEADRPYIPVAPAEDLPSFELAVSAAPGVKLRHDDPGVLAYRGEFAFRFGHRVNFGAYIEGGSISASNACGYDMTGPMPLSTFDFGTHNQFTSCKFFMPGLQLQIHVFKVKERQIDPYFGLSPGFRFSFVDYTPYVTSVPGQSVSDTFLAIVAGVRAGLDYHPRPDFQGWAIGAFVEGEIQVIGDEESHHNNNNDGGVKQALWLMFGARTSMAF